MKKLTRGLSQLRRSADVLKVEAIHVRSISEAKPCCRRSRSRFSRALLSPLQAFQPERRPGPVVRVGVAGILVAVPRFMVEAADSIRAAVFTPVVALFMLQRADSIRAALVPSVTVLRRVRVASSPPGRRRVVSPVGPTFTTAPLPVGRQLAPAG
ncbi:MAG TPA: hypothetical protein VMF32_06455 [Xanthobacteraceae bacterium]|nr:hypothetical protein [Xanthobacteraceae bacterium]